MKRNIIKYGIIFIPLLIGILVSLLVNPSSYSDISKPILSPPGALFPIAWSILYLLIGIVLYRLNNSEYDYDSTKVIVINLIINYIWPFLFFKFKLYYISAIWILLLLYSTSVVIDAVNKKNKISSYLLIPYYIWLLFALYLNVGVALLN